jgi:RNA polymerase sigma-70 factor (ECF subfamily)
MATQANSMFAKDQSRTWSGMSARLTARSRPAVELDDAGLIREAQRGNAEAFGELVMRYDAAVLRIAFRITRSEAQAQDVCQEVFLKAYQGIRSFNGKCSTFTWLYRIVANVCIDQLRKRRVRREEFHTSLRDGDSEDSYSNAVDRSTISNPERSVLSREIADKITCALNALSSGERLVFELKHCEGMRLRTIAAIMNTSENSAKVRLCRAVRKLRTHLQAAGIAPQG